MEDLIMGKQTSKGITVAKGTSKVMEQAKVEIKEVVEQAPAPTTIAELWKAINARLDVIENKLAVKVKEGNGRGPMSTRSMTEADAVRIMTGDLKAKSIKECAKELGLSYGQIYSARNGYTFKTQYAARKTAETAKK
jgi:hypothetical protein